MPRTWQLAFLCKRAVTVARLDQEKAIARFQGRRQTLHVRGTDRVSDKLRIVDSILGCTLGIVDEAVAPSWYISSPSLVDATATTCVPCHLASWTRRSPTPPRGPFTTPVLPSSGTTPGETPGMDRVLRVLPRSGLPSDQQRYRCGHGINVIDTHKLVGQRCSPRPEILRMCNAAFHQVFLAAHHREHLVPILNAATSSAIARTMLSTTVPFMMRT